MKAITKPILGPVMRFETNKCAFYFFKVGITDLGMTKVKCQNKRQDKRNLKADSVE
jgi:hypothetical protein